jgi:tetratricopeptide (TPR) repeat protein
VNVFELRDAEELLLKAIELDPNFAEAYELLAYRYLNDLGLFEPVEAQRLTGEAAAKALAIDPDLVFAQALYQSANVENYSHLGAIEAFERAVREQPGNPAALDAFIWDLLEAGYLQEALRVAERYIELDPLLPVANYYLVNALYAVGRTSEAVTALEVADQLGSSFANWLFGIVNLVEKRDDIAIAHFEADLQQYDYPDVTWVRELVTGARDPATGQAYLDRRIPEIIASMQEGEALEWQVMLTNWYQLFGFLDRHFEIILDLDLTDPTWTGAHSIIVNSTIFRRLGFTAHPKYLEVAELHGIVEVWEQRGPPDFCEKVDGEWVCE